MGILDFFKKKNTNLNLTDETFNPGVIDSYKVFYEKNRGMGEPRYGFIRFGEISAYPSYFIENFDSNITYEFQFDKACVWEDIRNKKMADKMWDNTIYGNVPIANLGCGSYLTLICSGRFAGEVWLLTEMGITPIRDNFGLNDLEVVLANEDSTFWYSAIKDWGPGQYAFLASHAIPKSITYYDMNNKQIEPLGVSSALCEYCSGFTHAAAMHLQEDIVIADPMGVHVFYSDGRIETVDE